MSDLIEPRTLRGFRDFLPEVMLVRERLMETARQVFRSYGFAPIDTPALEYAEILTGKGGEESDKQMYRFMHHDHDVALRFDLTVPFARFAAQHIGELGTPFKRYAMGPVWRGEFGGNAKAAAGVARLRELLDVATTAGVPEGRIRLDLSIARGLDYYTGTIYETFLLGEYVEKGQAKPLAGFGSVCSGGRYDN